MTLESQSNQEKQKSNNNNPAPLLDLSTIEWTSTELRDEFLYYLELLRSGERTNDIIRQQTIRLGGRIAEKFFKYGQPAMCKTISSIFTSYAHKHGCYSYDQIIRDTFKLPEWAETITRIEQSYRSSQNEYKNLLEQFSKPDKKAEEEIEKAYKIIHDNIPLASPDYVQDVLPRHEKTGYIMKETLIKKNRAVPASEYETEQTQTESVAKKEDQVKTPEYKIEEAHKRRQAMVADGLVYFEQRLAAVRTEVLPKTPIESDEQAERWRDGLMKLADNFAALGDNKHRMDFRNWAETFINIEKYGPEKGLKMSGYDITPKDLELIDEHTLPLQWNEKYKAVELSYISKEHLDSKGHIIANIFIDLFNNIPALAEMSEMFSYQAKLRGIRALQVSRKLSNNK